MAKYDGAFDYMCKSGILFQVLVLVTIIPSLSHSLSCYDGNIYKNSATLTTCTVGTDFYCKVIYSYLPK